MKKLLFAAILLLSAVSFAKLPTAKAEGVLKYDVTQANYSSDHVTGATRGELVLNYDKGQVSLNVEVAYHCPEGRVCLQVMPTPLRAELPIVSVKTDSCGIRVVTAQLDRRPVDGELQQIKVSDPSQMTCKTLVAVYPKATYTTSYFDRRNGKTVTSVSQMVLAQKYEKTAAFEQTEADVLETSMAPPIVIKYVVGSGFSPNPTNQNLYVDKTGRVINSVKVLRTGQVTTTQIAQLSPEALKSLTDKIATISVDSKLVDANEGEPRCMDAPTSSIVVTVKAHDVTVFQRSGCHNLETQDGYTSQLRDIMMGFMNLTY